MCGRSAAAATVAAASASATATRDQFKVAPAMRIPVRCGTEINVAP